MYWRSTFRSLSHVLPLSPVLIVATILGGCNSNGRIATSYRRAAQKEIARKNAGLTQPLQEMKVVVEKVGCIAIDGGKGDARHTEVGNYVL